MALASSSSPKTSKRQRRRLLVCDEGVNPPAPSTCFLILRILDRRNTPQVTGCVQCFEKPYNQLARVISLIRPKSVLLAFPLRFVQIDLGDLRAS